MLYDVCDVVGVRDGVGVFVGVFDGVGVFVGVFVGVLVGIFVGDEYAANCRNSPVRSRWIRTMAINVVAANSMRRISGRIRINPLLFCGDPENKRL